MRPKSKKEYGEQMRLVRVHLKLTIAEMAGKLGIAGSTLSKYEAGRVPPVDIYMTVMDLKKDIKQVLEA